jgi:hypothetical protein
MAVGIGAGGFIGIAFETTYGTYTAPTKYFPIKSESFKFMQDTYWRRVIRANVVSWLGATDGFSHIEGDLEMELMEDALPYFLYASRNTVAKTGAGADKTYTTTPTAQARETGSRSLSITIVRAGIVFGYTGCIVGKMSFTVDAGTPMMTLSVVGSDETVQSLPTPTWLTTSVPFGAGMYSIEIPTASQVFDCNGYTFEVDDNAEPQFRLNSSRKATYIKFGERSTTMKTTRDFDGRTEYDSFKTLTAQSISLVMTKTAVKKVTFKLPNAIRESYDGPDLTGQGDLITADVNFNGAFDVATSKDYEIVVICQEDIT